MSIPTYLAVRVFVVDRTTKAPVSNLPIIAEAVVEKGPTTPLGTLVSDVNGYVSFKTGFAEITGLSETAGLVNVYVYPKGFPELRQDVLPFISQNLGRAAYSYVVPVEQLEHLREGTLHTASAMPAVPTPDLADYDISPGSVITNPSAQLGQGDCSALVPTTMAKREYPLRQIVKSDGEIIRLEPRPVLPGGSGDGVNTGKKQPLYVRRGEILEYRVCWEPLGHSLGELLYSLPLAPCESVNIAVVDWMRHDQARRTEETSFTEELIHSVRRDRVVEEVLNASVKQFGLGFGLQSGVLGSIPGVDELTAFLGIVYSASYNERNLAADTVQKLSDNLYQRSVAARSLNSVAVYQASQQESEHIQTRNVTNHNHCHTLTLMYYEVLKHYKVITEYLGKGQALLIKYDCKPFTLASAWCNKHILQNRLLDPSLRDCFDAVGRVLYCSGDEQPGDAGNAECVKARKLSLTIRMGNDAIAGWINFWIRYKNGAETHHRIPRGSDVKYKKDTAYTLTLPISPTCIEDIDQIGLENEPRHGLDGPGTIARLNVTYEAANVGGVFDLYRNDNLNQRLQRHEHWWASVNPEIPTLEPDAGQPVVGGATPDECCANRLLAHLNCNKLYYNKLVWFFEDPDERALWLECYELDGQSLLDLVVNQPVAVLGEWVAFALLDYNFKPADPPEITTKEVVLPSRGVFAEALLGHCNACEVIDDERFWKWKDQPCPCSAPDINVSAGSRAQNQHINVDPSALPSSNIVSVQSAASLPNPTGLNPIAQAFANPNFTDPVQLAKLAELFKALAEALKEE